MAYPYRLKILLVVFDLRIYTDIYMDIYTDSFLGINVIVISDAGCNIIRAEGIIITVRMCPKGLM